MDKLVPFPGEPPQDRSTQPKKKYDKPAVVFERELEALAAVCDPNGIPKGKVLRGVDGCQLSFS